MENTICRDLYKDFFNGRSFYIDFDKFIWAKTCTKLYKIIKYKVKQNSFAYVLVQIFK